MSEFWKGTFIGSLNKLAAPRDGQVKDEKKEKSFTDSFQGTEYKAYEDVRPEDRPDPADYAEHDKKQFANKLPIGFILVQLLVKDGYKRYYYPVTEKERDRYFKLESSRDEEEFIEEFILRLHPEPDKDDD